MVAPRVVAALFACLLPAAPVAAQDARFDETIEVRVINVDAVVTGQNGVPVRGLAAKEFELLVDGQTVPIAYFAAMEDGVVARAGPSATDAQDQVDAGRTTKPFLALVWDQRAFRPKDASRVLGGVIDRLPALIEATRGIMVARQSRTLGIEQSFTSDGELIRAAIDRLDDQTAVSFARGERGLLLSSLARAPGPEDANSTDEMRLIEEQANRFLNQINLQALQERQEALGGLAQLRQMVNLLATLPGRKSVLYLGGGIQTRPAEALYRVWWDKYRTIASRLRVPSFGSQTNLTDVTSGFVALTREANRQRVAFYVHDVSGVEASAASVEHSSLEAIGFAAQESIDQQHNLLGLATSTGGLGNLHLTTVDPLIEALLRDLRSYYSLGFAMTDAIPEQGKIEVRVRGTGLRVRHFDRFDDTRGAGDLERAAMSTLLTNEGTNPLGVSVEVGAFERQRGGTYVVPLLITVPISHLTLLPEADRHVGRLTVVVMARSADGELSPPATGEVPIEIANAELLAAMGRLAGYRLRMEISPGEQTVAIGLKDEVARTLSTLNLVLQPGQGP